jgi:tetratricopeptide (TPR) repeat protein
MTPTPSSTPPGGEVPVAAVPPALPPRAGLRRLASLPGAFRRHPGRALAVLMLLALIVFGVGLAGTQLWASYHFRAARAALERYHTTEAGDHLGACLRVWPNDPDVLFLAARAARRAGLFGEADDFLNRCQDLRGRDDELTLERALLTADRGDVDDVMKFCRAKVAANDPASPLILESLARGCLRSYHLDDAEWAVRTWLEREPHDALAHYIRGRLARERVAQSDAAAAFRRALEIDPELDEAREQLAIVLVEMHQAPEALPHLEYLRRRRPDSPALAVNQAQCYDLLGRQNEAVELLDEVLARYPSYQPALAERGKLALNAGQQDQAETWLRRALAVAPGDATVLPQLQKCLVQMGRSDEAQALEPQLKQAREDLERINQLVNHDIQANPHNADLHYEVGMIFQRAGATAEGLRWLENAIRLNPRHAKAHEALADLYDRAGESAKAQRHRRLARELGGDKSAGEAREGPTRPTAVGPTGKESAR